MLRLVILRWSQILSLFAYCALLIRSFDLHSKRPSKCALKKIGKSLYPVFRIQIRYRSILSPIHLQSKFAQTLSSNQHIIFKSSHYCEKYSFINLNYQCNISYKSFTCTTLSFFIDTCRNHESYILLVKVKVHH
jgi:hypothetical protein